MKDTAIFGADIGKKPACEALGVPRSSFYRYQNQAAKSIRPKPPLALSLSEQQTVLDIMHSDRFIDRAPHHVYATLLDEGTYLCSIRTIYRILDKHNEVKERRKQVQRNNYSKPELLAKAPNQVWSWDITKLKGPVKWTYFYLYVIIDIFSRYVVGWMVAHREQASLAGRLLTDSCEKQIIKPDQLTIHADRGSSMTSKTVAFLMADLGITKSHSRPYMSNDNPFSESHFKTLKYCPEFPERFGSAQDARAFCQVFFHWYNTEHKHISIGLLTPEQVHYGMASTIIKHRSQVLLAAYQNNPKRFKGIIPKPTQLPEAVWINKPITKSDLH